MVSKPRRRIVSLLQLTILNFKSKQRFYLFLCALLATILFLLKKLSATSDGFPLIRFDRERGRFGTGKVKFPPLHELVDRDRLWPSDLAKPLCDLKIYVYTLPPSLSVSSAQTKQCRWSAYSSEIILYNLLLPSSSSASNPIPSRYVTTDPNEADVFFIPLFPACYLFNCWVKNGWNRSLRCRVEEDYILPVMEFIGGIASKEGGGEVVEGGGEYWKKNGGADHILIHPMDYTDSYYTESTRSIMNSSIYLTTIGDLRPVPYSQHYRRNKDIVIPSSTHLLNSYYFNPMDFLDPLGHPRAKKREPLPNPVKAFIFDPPTSASSSSDDSKIIKTTPRNTLALFRGGTGKPTELERYSLSIRTLFFPFTHPSNPLLSHPGFSSLPSFDIALESSNEEYSIALSQSKFGLVPPGYTLDTTRLWEYLAFGLVPVFIGTGFIAGQILPFSDDFDYGSFSISIPRSEAHRVPEILEGIKEEEYERLRKNVWDIGRKLVLEEGRGEVWNWIVRDLCRMRKEGGAGERTDWFG